MSLEDPRARPAVFPVPNPNGFVIGADSTRGRVGWTAKDLTKSLCASNSTIFSSVSQLAITIFRKEEMFQLSKNSKFGGFFWVCVTAGWRFCCTRVRVSSCEVKILGRRGFVSWVWGLCLSHRHPLTVSVRSILGDLFRPRHDASRREPTHSRPFEIVIRF